MKLRRLLPVVALIVALLLVGACRNIGPLNSPRPDSAASLTPMPSQSPAAETASTTALPATPVASPDPPPSAWAAPEPPNAAAYLECAERDAPPGLAIDDGLIWLRGGPTADAALERLLAEGLLMPQAGYERLHETELDVVFGYRSAGGVKVALRVSREPGGVSPGAEEEWSVWSLHACDHREYGADAELDPDLSVWRNHETDRILIDFQGWAHCNMESARFLSLNADDWYIRDPEGVFAGELTGRYRANVELPDDAYDTGHRRGDDELWIHPEGRAVYVVGEGRTERWPRHADEGPGCA